MEKQPEKPHLPKKKCKNGSVEEPFWHADRGNPLVVLVSSMIFGPMHPAPVSELISNESSCSYEGSPLQKASLRLVHVQYAEPFDWVLLKYETGAADKLAEIASVRHLSSILSGFAAPDHALCNRRVVAKQRKRPTSMVKLAFCTELARFKDCMLVPTRASEESFKLT